MARKILQGSTGRYQACAPELQASHAWLPSQPAYGQARFRCIQPACWAIISEMNGYTEHRTYRLASLIVLNLRPLRSLQESLLLVF
jgi:hypothetical protein